MLREGQPPAGPRAPDGWLDGKDTPGVGMLSQGAVLNNDEISGIRAGFGDVGRQFNFGEILPVSIAGVVYHDRNDDGDQDPR